MRLDIPARDEVPAELAVKRDEVVDLGDADVEVHLAARGTLSIRAPRNDARRRRHLREPIALSRTEGVVAQHGEARMVAPDTKRAATVGPLHPVVRPRVAGRLRAPALLHRRAGRGLARLDRRDGVGEELREGRCHPRGGS